jgi:hypothetical protein
MEPDPFVGTTKTGFLCGGTDIPTSQLHQTTETRCWCDGGAAAENVHALVQDQFCIPDRAASAPAKGGARELAPRSALHNFETDRSAAPVPANAGKAIVAFGPTSIFRIVFVMMRSPHGTTAIL